MHIADHAAASIIASPAEDKLGALWS
jgi:hypothetical protein